MQLAVGDKRWEGGGCWCCSRYFATVRSYTDTTVTTHFLLIWLFYEFYEISNLPMISIFENCYGVENYLAIFVPSLIRIL